MNYLLDMSREIFQTMKLNILFLILISVNHLHAQFSGESFKKFLKDTTEFPKEEEVKMSRSSLDEDPIEVEVPSNDKKPSEPVKKGEEVSVKDAGSKLRKRVDIQISKHKDILKHYLDSGKSIDTASINSLISLIELKYENEQYRLLNEQKEKYQKKIEQQSNFLSVLILVFGLLLFIALLVFIGSRHQGLGENNRKLVGMIVIATFSIYLISAGFNNEQITPVIGLLGTLAGYVLSSNPTNNNGSLNLNKKKNESNEIGSKE